MAGSKERNLGFLPENGVLWYILRHYFRASMLEAAGLGDGV